MFIVQAYCKVTFKVDLAIEESKLLMQRKKQRLISIQTIVYAIKIMSQKLYNNRDKEKDMILCYGNRSKEENRVS